MTITITIAQPQASLRLRPLDQRLTPEHALADLPHHISPIALADQDDSPTSSAHAPGPAEPMDEIDRGMRHVVQDHVADGEGVDAAGAKIRGDEDFGVGEGFAGGRC